jgi:hypothetical protein
MRQPIPILADTPSQRPGLGFRDHASALADAIRGGNPPQFTVGIYGPWGSGKSSLLTAIKHDLKEDDCGIVPVMFDAWRYEHSENILVPLLHRIYVECKEFGDERLINYATRVLTEILSEVSIKLSGVEFKLHPGRLRRFRDKSNLVALDEAFSRPFTKMANIPKQLGDRRVVVLIDDLDRCSPENIVALLESINVLMDVWGFIYVLALDYDVLVAAIAMKYPHASGHAVVQKMIQVPFWVPRLDLQRETFLNDLIPEWDVCAPHLPKSFPGYTFDITSLAFDGNPRQIKRFVNASLVLRRILQQRSLRVDDEHVAAIMGLQLRWPDRFADVREAAFADERGDPYHILAEKVESDPSLHRYYERFFKNLTKEQRSVKTLRQILQLTETVASPRVKLGEGWGFALPGVNPDQGIQVVCPNGDHEQWVDFYLREHPPLCPVHDVPMRPSQNRTSLR